MAHTPKSAGTRGSGAARRSRREMAYTLKSAGTRGILPCSADETEMAHTPITRGWKERESRGARAPRLQWCVLGGGSVDLGRLREGDRKCAARVSRASPAGPTVL